MKIPCKDCITLPICINRVNSIIIDMKPDHIIKMSTRRSATIFCLRMNLTFNCTLYSDWHDYKSIDEIEMKTDDFYIVPFLRKWRKYANKNL